MNCHDATTTLDDQQASSLETGLKVGATDTHCRRNAAQGAHERSEGGLEPLTTHVL